MIYKFIEIKKTTNKIREGFRNNKTIFLIHPLRQFRIIHLKISKNTYIFRLITGDLVKIQSNNLEDFSVDIY